MSNAAMDSGRPVYKGKVTHRSWPQLPEELVRHIATFYLWDLSVSSYCPQVFEARENWHHRMVYTALRDAIELERHVMSICPQWQIALEKHLFWQHAITLIDPMDILGHNAIIQPPSASLNSSSAPISVARLSPYRHFRNITNCSCYVCRISAPATTIGLTIAKRAIVTPFLKTIAVCREHDRRRRSFCGLCLRDAPMFEHATHESAENYIGCLENEDDETWPGVDATCRTCRSEWLWKRVYNNPRDREAIGGSRMVSEDWETRQCVEGFIDSAESSISDVVTLAQEKWWLRKYTRLGDLMQQALAATRLRDGDPEPEEEEEEEEYDEEDLELMQITEESGVRDLALADWARTRVLDGHWFSPADYWYNNALPGKPMAVPAIHPCPWTRDSPSSAGSSPAGDRDEEEQHPKESTIKAEIPPSFSLCEQAYIAHSRAMSEVLMPPMRNIVRRIVIECSTPRLPDGKVEDPAIRAARMDMEDVLTELREEEGVWFDGFDWAERRMNDGREREKREREERENGSRSDASSTSSCSRSSNGTSPVLSTTTLQTTPSPPPIPLGEEGGKKAEDEEIEELSRRTAATEPAKPVLIAIAPVLDPPKLLRAIPYVPITVAHMPQFSLEAFRAVWREACAPLYHCRCKICERAMAKANHANGNQQPVIVVPSQAPTQAPPSDKEHPVTIKLDDEVDIDGEGEEEIDSTELEEEEGEGDMEEVEDIDGYPEFGSHSDEDDSSSWCDDSSPISAVPAPRSRKRSCDELDDFAAEDKGHLRSGRGGTPPKRARMETNPLAQISEAQMRLYKKRSSHVLEERGGKEGEVPSKRSKRVKVASSNTSVGDGNTSSESPPPTSDCSLPSSVSTEDMDFMKRISPADLEQLIVLGDE